MMAHFKKYKKTNEFTVKLNNEELLKVINALGEYVDLLNEQLEDMEIEAGIGETNIEQVFKKDIKDIEKLHEEFMEAYWSR